jgi:hypothetical protein
VNKPGCDSNLKPYKKKTRTFLSEGPGHNTGNNLLSHSIEAALPLAIEGLTAVVGMGTGVTPHQWSPEWFMTYVYSYCHYVTWSEIKPEKLVKLRGCYKRLPVAMLIKSHGSLVLVSLIHY